MANQEQVKERAYIEVDRFAQYVDPDDPRLVQTIILPEEGCLPRIDSPRVKNIEPDVIGVDSNGHPDHDWEEGFHREYGYLGSKNK